MNLEENIEINKILKINNSNLFILSNNTNQFIKEAEKYKRLKQEQTLKIIAEENSNIKNEEAHNIDGEIYNDLLIDKIYIIEIEKKFIMKKEFIICI